MKKFSSSKLLMAAAILTLSANAAAAEFIYKPASLTRIATNLQKVEGGHLERFKKPFEVQRLSQNIYWISVANYNVTLLVGETGALLIDAPIHAGKRILKAIEAITDKPLRGIVYSHAHADHVGDSGVILKELSDNNIDIYATEEVRVALISHKVTLPAPVTKIISDKLVFEGHTFEVYQNFDGHTPDNTGFLIKDGGRKILHAIDLIHPDQLEFRSFSNVEDAIAYKNDIDYLLSLDWDVMVTGHSNLGYKEDVKFVQEYIRDIQSYIHQGHSKADFSNHLKSNTPFAWYAGYSDEVIDFATSLLAEKYREGREEEFDIVARSHVEVLFWAMLARAL
ncbi:MBL fold metallo-hydrolase [Endozoicomonas sp. SM1973]|uniref:MBL fold metallo-hydrolase n=1 Tax=Spartinivicinus marinus TaxID=2994442 RepID=A0A853I007_9GAMM|nr:MBL fold metallo-hydrolase [Spartinivicinus marinus]MCX4026892.1 MBL fold metallo-hydrolase [Spartinivicinus marinus]NYZ66763.1 MBL fold metallo-hydrolase [Spartinivicinus marinus]